MARCDAAVLGAGPYGLAAAAHLAAIPGVDVRIFGEPMEFWRGSMPKGMCLRSPHYASNISDPDEALRVEDYYAERGDPALDAPITMERFTEYGEWFQRKALPGLDRRRVERVEPDGKAFRLLLEGGEELSAGRVVVAAGIAPFARRPDAFAGLPAELACHCCQATDLSVFSGKSVVVVGAGQSALETAALIREAGAEVEVLVRQDRVRWHGKGGAARKLLQLGPLKPVLYARTGVGPIIVSRIVSFPGALRYFPRKVQDDFLAKSLQPSASWSFFERLRGAKITTSAEVVAAREEGGRARLTLNDGGERLVDRVVLATGYKTDIARYPFLSDALLGRVRAHDGYPVLGRGLESSVPGLHFVGAPATWSFGPLMHFVAGTPFTARHLSRFIARRI